MKARVIKTGEIIEVEYDYTYDGELGYWDANNCDFYDIGELDVDHPECVTIEGWVAVDEYGMGGCFLHTQKPHAESREFCDTGEYEIGWHSDGVKYELDSKLFPDLTPECEPKKVKITITPIE